jgi:hypothetical protein
MFGSKNSEFTRKYDSNWFDSINFWLRKMCLVAYSTKPTPANTTASATDTPNAQVTTRAGHSTLVSSFSSNMNGT